MPAKNVTRHPQNIIDVAVKRHLNGESVAVLAKYYGMSRPGFYLWVKKFKDQVITNSMRADMSLQGQELADVGDLKLQVQAERAENLRLKRLCCELMLKTGDFSMLSDR